LLAVLGLMVAAVGMYRYIVAIRTAERPNGLDPALTGDSWGAGWWLFIAILGLAIAVAAVLLDILQNDGNQ
jgi:hypothetical protein